MVTYIIDAAQDSCTGVCRGSQSSLACHITPDRLYKYYLEVYLDALQVLYYYLTHIQVNYLEVKLQGGTESQLIITH